MSTWLSILVLYYDLVLYEVNTYIYRLRTLILYTCTVIPWCFRWFSDGFHIGFRWVSDGIHIGFRWVSNRFQMGFRWVSDGFQVYFG